MRKGSEFLVPGSGFFAATAALFYMCHTLRAQDSTPVDAKVALTAAQRQESDAALALLRKAVDAMKSRVWRVDGRMEQQESGDKKAWSDLHATYYYTGLLSGGDYDVTQQSADRQSSERRIGSNGKTWASTGGGGTWNELKGTDAAAFYQWMSVPMPDDRLRLAENAKARFEIAGKETHEDGAWLHISGAGYFSIFTSHADYWILLDAKGGPACVRRFSIMDDDGEFAGMRLCRVRTTVDFTPAKDGEKIVPPKEEK